MLGPGQWWNTESEWPSAVWNLKPLLVKSWVSVRYSSFGWVRWPQDCWISRKDANISLYEGEMVWTLSRHCRFSGEAAGREKGECRLSVADWIVVPPLPRQSLSSHEKWETTPIWSIIRIVGELWKLWILWSHPWRFRKLGQGSRSLFFKKSLQWFW